MATILIRKLNSSSCTKFKEKKLHEVCVGSDRFRKVEVFALVSYNVVCKKGGSDCIVLYSFVTNVYYFCPPYKNRCNFLHCNVDASNFLSATKGYPNFLRPFDFLLLCFLYLCSILWKHYIFFIFVR